MNCPNCYKNLENNNICPHCETDVLLFNKTIDISAKFYNHGLAEAAAGNLSAAVRNLLKSVEYNRFNYLARNLLGLVFNEMGMTGDALKHWVISAGYVKEDNPATKYIDDVQSNERLLDKHAEAIHLYNKALDDLKFKNEDMAVIELKKALDCNPKLVAAYNLLALCYMYQKSNEKALSLVEKALEIDNGNEISLFYYRKLNASRTKAPVKVNERRKEKYNVKKSGGNSFHIAEILTFLIGLACAFGIFYIMIMPDVITAHNEEIDHMNAAVTQLNQAHAEEINRLDSSIKMLEEEQQRLITANGQLADEIELQTRINKINHALTLMIDNEYEEAAVMLDSMDITNFSTYAVRVYNYIKETTHPVLEKNYYDEGLRLYNARNYAEAKELFNKSVLYVTPDSNYIDDSYYFLGRIAELDGDKNAAKAYFEIIVNEYPGSNQFYNARSRLNNL